MADTKQVLDMIQEHDVKYVDFRFTDPRGKWQHLAHHVRTINDEFLNDGVPFDGSSITGWKAINESDMLLVPDCTTAVLDPFAAQTSLILFCDVHEPLTGQPYSRDPRSIAKKAEQHLIATGIGDTAYFGPEAEFFIFDDVRYKSTMNSAMYEVDSEEGPYVTGKKYPDGNTGHRPAIKGGYFPVPPVDSQSDLRAEMLSVMFDMGLGVEKHHHEVAPSQAELGFVFSTLVRTADNMQIYKYVVHNVAHQYGKTATFMPKPIKGDNGSGMHTHQSLWKGERPLFAGNQYADLSELALYYIGGIIRHAKAINAFTNPTTNSYKRLIPGFEAPVLLAYSARNRSASCRIPIVASPKAKRVEVRYPDPAANPYLAFAAMMMAGLDGIQNRIHPGDAMDKNLYDLPPEELKDIPTVCGSLRDALTELQNDHAFLLKGDVFNRDFIESYTELKWEEVYNFEHTPHPVEFQMYYSV
jgi:glutamine synthetase